MRAKAERLTIAERPPKHSKFMAQSSIDESEGGTIDDCGTSAEAVQVHGTIVD
jgi:hypothetical protein